MKKSTDEAVMLARYIANFLNEYAPSQITDSSHTLKSYQQALLLYITFLETEKKTSADSLCGKCFERMAVEEWLTWLKTSRGCSPATCNIRLASLRTFLKCRLI